MKLFNWLSSLLLVASLLLLTGCPSPAPQKQKVQYASAKSPPEHAASPGQPEKALKPTKITLAWTNNASQNVFGFKLYQGPEPWTYTNSVLVFTTNAVATVYQGKTYYFSVILISTQTNADGSQKIVQGINPTELAYTVPNKPGGGPK